MCSGDVLLLIGCSIEEYYWSEVADYRVSMTAERGPASEGAGEPLRPLRHSNHAGAGDHVDRNAQLFEQEEREGLDTTYHGKSAYKM